MKDDDEGNGLGEVVPDLVTQRLQEFIRYTDEKGWRGIDSSGVIRSRQRRVFVTT